MSRTTILAFRVAFAALLAGATYLALTPAGTSIGLPYDKANHLAAYYVLAFGADFAFPRAGYYLPKGLPLFTYGLLIEVIQREIPTRFAEAGDLVGNLAGIALYAASVPLLKKVPLLQGRWDDRGLPPAASPSPVRERGQG